MSMRHILLHQDRALIAKALKHYAEHILVHPVVEDGDKALRERLTRLAFAFDSGAPIEIDNDDGDVK